MEYDLSVNAGSAGLQEGTISCPDDSGPYFWMASAPGTMQGFEWKPEENDGVLEGEVDIGGPTQGSTVHFEWRLTPGYN